MTQVEPLSFEAFQAMLAGLLKLDAAQLTPEAHFVADLAVDSLHMLRVLLHLEQIGVELPLDRAWQIQTVGDAYRCYCEQVADHWL
jgi:acyl carrier protein